MKLYAITAFDREGEFILDWPYPDKDGNYPLAVYTRLAEAQGMKRLLKQYYDLENIFIKKFSEKKWKK